MRRLVLVFAATLCLPSLASAQATTTTREERREMARRKAEARKAAARRKSTPKAAGTKAQPRKQARRAPKPRGPQPGPFAQGRSRFALRGGTVGQFDNSYIVIGGGYGYFIANGLELALDAALFLGGDPSITTVSPSVRYVVWQLGMIKPYAGAFAQRQFLGEYRGVDLDDIDSVGARGGVLWVTGRTFMTVGVAYETVLDCQSADQDDCERIYPEFGFGLSF